MAFIKTRAFIGAIPGVSSHLLPENAAQSAINCKLINGNLAPLRDNLSANTPTKAGTILSIYKFLTFWFHWLADVDVIKGPIAGDIQERTYFTENGEMRVTDATIATAAGTNYPMDWYKVGIPAPENAMTTTLNGSIDPDPVIVDTEESRTYVYTYISGWGEEGPPSPASGIIDWAPGQTVALSGLPTNPPTGDYNIIGIRIYRYLEGAYKFLMDANLSSSTQSDAVDSDSLGEEIPSVTWYPPPSGMHSIVNHPGSFVVGADGNEIVPSEAGLPHAYNPLNRQTVPYDIVGLGIVGQGILILTGGGIWYAAGSSPDNLGVEKVETDQACVSKRSIFEYDSAVGFASPDGLFIYGMGTYKFLTEGLFTRDQWQAYSPETMLCKAHDGKVFVFYDNGTKGGFIIHPGSPPTMTSLDFHATAAYVDKENDILYMMVGLDIVSFEGAATYRSATWKGRRVKVSGKICPTVARVEATAYPVTFNLYVKLASAPAQTVIDQSPSGFTITGTAGIMKLSVAVADATPFRLPTGYLSGEFEVECVLDSGEVEEIDVLESMTDLRGA